MDLLGCGTCCKITVAPLPPPFLSLYAKHLSLLMLRKNITANYSLFCSFVFCILRQFYFSRINILKILLGVGFSNVLQTQNFVIRSDMHCILYYSAIRSRDQFLAIFFGHENVPVHMLDSRREPFIRKIDIFFKSNLLSTPNSCVWASSHNRLALQYALA